MVERLDYLASLGVNAVELLPVQVRACVRACLHAHMRALCSSVTHQSALPLLLLLVVMVVVLLLAARLRLHSLGGWCSAGPIWTGWMPASSPPRAQGACILPCANL